MPHLFSLQQKFLSALAAGFVFLATGAAFAQTSAAVPEAATRAPITSAILRQRISLSYVAENLSPAATANYGDNSAFESQQHLGLAFQLTPTRTIQFRQYFYYNMTDYRQTNEWALGEHAIRYTNDVLRIGNESVAAYAQLYLPGSTYARRVGRYELRLFADLERRLSNNFSVNYQLNPRLYGYTGNDDGQYGLRLLPAVYGNYRVNRWFTPYVGVYTDHIWRHSGANINSNLAPQDPAATFVNNDSAWYVLGAKFKPTPNVDVALYSETEDNLRRGDDFALLRDDQTIYYLDLSVGL